MSKPTEQAKSAVLTVGFGRGFVVESLGKRVVVTGAHCLPRKPPRHGASQLDERTYRKLLGPLGAKPTVWAECFFAEAIADIAVLGSPDEQILSDAADAYDALVESVKPLKITPAPIEGRAWLLSLEGEWFQCSVTHQRREEGPLLVIDPAQSITGGMSGSPILSDDGKAIGAICLGGGHGERNPRLTRDLPARFLRPRRRKLRPSELHPKLRELGPLPSFKGFPRGYPVVDENVG
jgi:hypothetical protein